MSVHCWFQLIGVFKMDDLRKKIKDAKKESALASLYDELRDNLNKNFSTRASLKEKKEKIIWLRDLITKIENDDPEWEKMLATQ